MLVGDFKGRHLDAAKEKQPVFLTGKKKKNQAQCDFSLHKPFSVLDTWSYPYGLLDFPSL